MRITSRSQFVGRDGAGDIFPKHFARSTREEEEERKRMMHARGVILRRIRNAQRMMERYGDNPIGSSDQAQGIPMGLDGT